LVFSLTGEGAAQSLSPATEKLFEAVYDGDLAQVQISIAAGADISALNTWGIMAVDLAVDKGHFDIVHFLLQVRDTQSQNKKPLPPPAPAIVTSLGATAGQPASVPPPAPAAAPVGEVYSPPTNAGPWSAIVVTSEPPPPPAAVFVEGPSPFDQQASSDAALPIIGTVRGPTINTNVQQSVETTVQEPVEKTRRIVVQQPVAATPPTKAVVPPSPAPEPEPAPVFEASVPKQPETKPEPAQQIAKIEVAPKQVEPAAQEETGIWNTLKNIFKSDVPAKTETPAAPKPAAILEATAKPSPPVPLKEVRKPASLGLKTAPVSPPNVSGPPPPIDEKILPENVTPAQLANLSDDDLEPTQVVPIRTDVPASSSLKSHKTPTQPTSDITKAKVTRISKTENVAPKPGVKLTANRPAVQVGATTPPGKPREQEGFFSKVMSIFSSDEENKVAAQKAPADSAKTTEENDDWSVKDIQQAQVVPRKPTRRVVRELPDNRLNGVILSIGTTTSLGKLPPPQVPAPWYYKSCIDKKLGSIAFCIEPLDWPGEINPFFLTDSILYEGTKTIVRYDEGAATYFHTLFPSESYASIVSYFSRRFGPPTQKLKRSIAPLAEPRRINPTVIWQSIAPVTNLLTTLEIRMYDDNRGGFPDTRRGAVYLYHEWSQPVFPQLSSVELMLLRSEAKQR
jgi:hypothetical protein